MHAPVAVVTGILAGKSCAEPLRELSRREVIGYSVPGFDGRPRLEKYTPTPYDYAADLVAQLPERAHLVGICSGCSIVLAAAHAYPERVTSVTLVSYWHRAKEWESRKQMLEVGVEEYLRRRMHKLVHEDGAVREKVKANFMAAMTDPEAVMQVGRMMVEHPVKNEYLGIRQPLAGIVGLQDKVTSPAAQVNVHAKRGAKLLAVDDVGHCVHYEAPQKVVAFLEPFWTEAEEKVLPRFRCCLNFAGGGDWCPNCPAVEGGYDG